MAILYSSYSTLLTPVQCVAAIRTSRLQKIFLLSRLFPPRLVLPRPLGPNMLHRTLGPNRPPRVATILRAALDLWACKGNPVI